MSGRDYSRVVSPMKTPQTEPIPGSTQVPNNNGGYSWAVNDWTRLERFLILGAEGGTYYIGKKNLIKENASAVVKCLAADPARTIDTIVEISESGRALKNDQAIFSLALAAKMQKNPETRSMAYGALPRVCRTGSHLLQFIAMCRDLGHVGGKGFQRAISRWYLNKAPRDFAYQVAKYQNREGDSHVNAIRLSHPNLHKDCTETQHTIIRWVLKGWDSVGDQPHDNQDLQILWAFEQSKKLKDKKDIPKLVDLITKYRLPHEMISSEMQRHPEVWEAMVPSMGLTALIRSLGRMTSLGVIAPLSKVTRYVTNRLGDQVAMKKARIHPLSLLIAQRSYDKGSSNFGGKRGVTTSWSPVPAITEALNSAFYTSYKAVTPAGKNFLLAVDCSDSMTWDSSMVCNNLLQSREGAAVMSLVTANIEPSWHVMGFDTGLIDIGISPGMSLSTVCKKMAAVRHGGTDCAVPMTWALKNKIPVDVFCVYTDNETGSRSIHPALALKEYRQKMGRDAKLVVIGMVSNGFTIADPDDSGMLDLVGFDASAPAAISSFAGVKKEAVEEDEVD